MLPEDCQRSKQLMRINDWMYLFQVFGLEKGPNELLFPFFQNKWVCPKIIDRCTQSMTLSWSDSIYFLSHIPKKAVLLYWITACYDYYNWL